MIFLVANTLGTVAGDFLSDNLEMGFMLSAAVIAVILVITVQYRNVWNTTFLD